MAENNTLDKLQALALKYLRSTYDDLPWYEKKIIESLVKPFRVAKDTTKEFDESRTLGERVADSVASFGGSWPFIFLFGSVLLGWVILNSFLLAAPRQAFDPYPYILLNLFLSMLASIQAPIIMMSQKRQSAKDRMDAIQDYQVNLKAELEIQSLHEKVDAMNHALLEAQIHELQTIVRENNRLLQNLAQNPLR